MAIGTVIMYAANCDKCDKPLIDSFTEGGWVWDSEETLKEVATEEDWEITTGSVLCEKCKNL